MSEQRSQVSTDVDVILEEELERSNCVADALAFIPSSSSQDEEVQGSSSQMITDVAQSSATKDDKTKDNNETKKKDDQMSYKMNHSNGRTCLVFNHDTFADTKLSHREGSKYDVERIETTFEKLGFEVVVHNNLEPCNVKAKIEEFSKPENHVNNDCICVFVLTPGQVDDASDPKTYKSDSIWKPFTADNCPSLAGKPKLFFFQACRGTESDGGVEIQMEQSADQVCEATDAIVNSYTIPTRSDFLIAHSCSEGFKSWRYSLKGSWYIQSLCDVLDEFAESTDLLKMMTITTRRVAFRPPTEDQEGAEDHKMKQAPSTTSTLTRDLYFPKPLQ